MKSGFSSRKVKITVEDCYFEDLKRNGILITVWNKQRLLFRSSSISSDELWENTERVIDILGNIVKSPQAKRWFKKEMMRE